MKHESYQTQKKSKTLPFGGYNRNQLLSKSEVDSLMIETSFLKLVEFFGGLYSQQHKDEETNPFRVVFKLVVCREGLFVTKDEFMRVVTRLYDLMDDELEKYIH
jgi:hypothetical protein